MIEGEGWTAVGGRARECGLSSRYLVFIAGAL